MNVRDTGFVPYEYLSINVSRDNEAECSDIYENFGWQPVGGAEAEVPGRDMVTLRFKRPKSIKNRAQLHNIQRKCEKSLRSIKRMERRKTDTALIAAMAVGCLGAGAIAGAVFSFFGGNIPLLIAFSVLGVIGTASPYFIFRKVEETKTMQLDPLIEEEYDKLYKLCDEARRLWIQQ